MFLQIRNLKNKIGVRLITRTSRGISLTEEGQIFYTRCTEIRRNIASALDLADSLSEKPTGTLRVNTTVAFGKSQILPLLPEFYAQYPNISISIDFNDRPINITVKPIDVMKYLIKMITPADGVLYDPFTGSGTTLVAAKELGYSFVGCEMEQKYVKIANERLSTINNLQEFMIK